jgi:hypothetical protein
MTSSVERSRNWGDMSRVGAPGFYPGRTMKKRSFQLIKTTIKVCVTHVKDQSKRQYSKTCPRKTIIAGKESGAKSQVR